MPRMREAVAVVGGSCRFPGAADLDQFWALLRDGRDAVGPVPQARWNWAGAPLQAGLIASPDLFDAAFFGIAPREADQMDPQQRLLLEVSWEALEAAGATRAGLAGSRSGVYIGIASVDYARIRPDDPALLDAYAATGAAPGVAANRLSYLFDLRGPSMAVDTACSSSLVAAHLACRALAAGDIDLAVVGGVNLLLAPDLMAVFTAARMLAPDGRCKTFDAAANGYGRGEGCGVVVLKRLADATASGDPILAVIRGTAVNQDGRSNGLTAPNGQAQTAVIAMALEDAGLPPEAIDAVELHGTGTALGDPIEARALAVALAPRRACPVGSVKTNIGHLEAAAGVAGLLKATLAVRHRRLPASLHFSAANPDIPLAALGLAVATSPVSWPDDQTVRIGVSSFGFGGTNAHVIVESPPPVPARPAVSAGPWLLPISAHTAPALRARAVRFAACLQDAAAADICHTAALRRTHLDHRLAVVGTDAADLAAQLQRHLAGDAAATVWQGRRPPAGPRGEADAAPGDLPALAARYAAGHDLDWQAIQPPGRVVDLPALPWQRRRHWYPTPDAAAEIAWRIDWQKLPGSIAADTAARLDSICAGFAQQALRQLGPEEPAPARRAAYDRMCQRLARHPAPADLAAGPALQALIAAEPDLAAELALLGRTGAALADVLRGAADPLAQLFPRGDLAALRGLYADAPAARRANRLVARAAAGRGAGLRVLEIGGGTGGTTGAVLDALAAPASYVFTDLSEAFLQAAAQRFGERGVTCRRLDIEQAPAAQGFAPGGFDLIVAANVLHATRSVADSLAHINWLLAPGGALVLLETVQTSWPLELTFGLTEGWWRFTDRDQPLLDMPAWRARLLAQGFATAYAMPCDSAGRQAVLVATPQLQAAPHWRLRGGGAADRLALTRTLLAHGLVVDATAASADVVVDLGLEGDAAARAAWSLESWRELAGGRLWTVTSEAATDPAQAALWGLGRTAAREHPAGWGGLIDLAQPLCPLAVLATIAAGPDQPETLLRGDRVLIPVLVPEPRIAPKLRLDGTVLVTGGLGGLGLLLAAWLIEHGARHLVLAGRRPGNAASIDALRQRGVSIDTIVLDMTCADDVAACVRRVAPRGIVHCAGIHDDGRLADLDHARLAAAFGAKLQGALALDAATQAMDLDLFLLVSSASSVTGLPGAGSYTAANAALDALAQRRRTQGLTALSIGFAPLDGVGMAREVGTARWHDLGVRPLDAGQALARLATLPQDGPAHLLLMHAVPEAAPKPVVIGPLQVAADIAALVGDILKLPDLDHQRGLQDQGLDSLMALELHARLQTLTGLRLPATLALEQPSVQALSAYVQARLSPTPPAEPPAARQTDTSWIAALTEDAALARLLEMPA